MNPYLWLHVPLEIHSAPLPDQERILEAARSRAGFYLPAYWTAAGRGLGLGLCVAGLLLLALQERSVWNTTFWIILSLCASGVILNWAMYFRDRRLMRRAVRQVLADENIELTDPS